MATLVDPPFLVVYAVAVVVFFYIYKFCLYSVRYNTHMIVSRGGRLTRILGDGNHWVMPWERVETITLKLGTQTYFSGNRLPVKLEFNNTIKIDVKGLSHEYKVLILFCITNVETFLRLGNSPMDVFYGLMLAEFTQVMQTKPFVWSDADKMTDTVLHATNKSLKDCGVQISEFKVLWAIEDEEVQPILKKNELLRIVTAMDVRTEKDAQELQLLRIHHERDRVIEQSNLEALRRKRQEEIAMLGVEKKA